MPVLSLVLLCLIGLRFPRNKSVAAVITERYGRPVLNLYRSLERQDYKIRKVQCDLLFLKCCQSQDLVPNFLKFKLPNRNLHHSSSYRKCQKDLLASEIRCKTRTLRNGQLRKEQLSTQLRSAVYYVDFNYLIDLVEKTNCNTICRTKFIQQRKLKNLGYVSDCNIDSSKVIFNFSDVILTEEEKCALSKGLKFSFPPFRLNFISHFLPFEKLFKDVFSMDFYDPLNRGFQVFKQSLSHLAHSSFYSYNPFSIQRPFDNEWVKLMKNLAKNKNIVVTKPDKGNGVVLLNKSDYLEKMHDILSDRSKFSPITSDPYAYILKNEDKINRVLRKLKTSGKIGDSAFHSIYSTGSKPGIMYGLPKVHKEGCPLRPILSAIGTHNYKLAKFLVPIINPITENEYSVKDSFSFVKEISELSVNDCVMASFDVKSLFTNIPLDETVDICINSLFENEEDKILNFSKKEMKDLLTLAAHDCMFLFDGKFYVQKDGCAMGSPVGPSFANAFLSYHERKWLSECPPHFKPTLYRRYVDDTFLVFRHNDHITLFLDYLNSKHDNIEFTCDSEENGHLSFLDIDIKRTESGFETAVYRKPTFTGLTTKFTSFIPLQFKRNLAGTLVYRAFHICSTYINFHKEIWFLTKMLFNNGFPNRFTETCVGKVLSKIFNNKHPEKPTVKKKDIYFSLPYLGEHSFHIRKKLNGLFDNFYPQIKLRVIFKSTCSFGKFFNIKDKIPEDLRAGIVYKYQCDSCNASYVGKSVRHKIARIREHLGRSPRTGNYLVKPSFSAIREHCESSDHLIRKENFSVLASSSDSTELVIMEALYQTKIKPTLGRSTLDLLCF